VLWQIDLDTVHPVHDIVARVATHVYVLAAEDMPDLVVLVPLPEQLPIGTLIVLKTQDIKGCTLVRTASSRLVLLQGCHLLGLTLALIIHELPSLKVSIVFLNTINTITLIMITVFSRSIRGVTYAVAPSAPYHVQRNHGSTCPTLAKSGYFVGQGC
jgi:hypothetical protein